MTKTSNKGSPCKKPVNPDDLTPLQLRGMDLILAGMPLQDVAEKVGRSRQTISEWKNHHPGFKAKLEELRAEAEEELSFALPMNEAFMLGQLRRLAQEGPHEARLNAIKYYFDRFARSELDVDKNNPLLAPSSDMLHGVLNRFRNPEKS